MNIFGKASEDTLVKLSEKYGTGTWDAGCGINSDEPYLKLQGHYIREDIISGKPEHPEEPQFWSYNEEEYKTYKKKFTNRYNIFHDEEITFDMWVMWYEEEI